MINPFKRLSLKNRSMLNKPSKPALPEDDLDEQIEYMFQVMKDNNGIGLAANQIGLDKRVIVVHANGFKQAIINPEIVRAYGGLRQYKNVQ